MTHHASLLVLLTVSLATPSAQDAGEPARLVRQLGQFPAALDPRLDKRTGGLSDVEQRREAIYIRLRALADAAVPALQRGLADENVRVRRNVALYLGWEGGNFAKHAAAGLDLTPFLAPLVAALRDGDERVAGLAAQALAYVGAAAAVAGPDLIRLLGSASESLRNSACIGLAGIGPAAREALPALRRALLDSSRDVRRFAERAIERIERVPTEGTLGALAWFTGRKADAMVSVEASPR